MTLKNIKNQFVNFGFIENRNLYFDLAFEQSLKIFDTMILVILLFKNYYSKRLETFSNFIVNDIIFYTYRHFPKMLKNLGLYKDILNQIRSDTLKIKKMMYT